MTGQLQKQYTLHIYCSTLKVETTISSEMSVDFQQTTQSYIPEDRTLNNDRYENIKSHIKSVHEISGSHSDAYLLGYNTM
jgi:hypothetical protein